MNVLFAAWGVSAALLVVMAVALGRRARRSVFGILIDSRGRYSLTQLQLVLWSVLVLSMIAGVVCSRLQSTPTTALDFAIPTELLTVMGIALGSSATSMAIKAQKDLSRPERIAASDENDRPRLSQMFLLEEGELADQAVDVTKFQNFWITIVLLAAYVGLAIATFRPLASSADIMTLPTFSATLLTLLGASHAGYLAGKLPNRAGTPQGLTLQLRSVGAQPAPGMAAAAPPTAALTYVPRNPR